jgi:hypothetical protein
VRRLQHLWRPNQAGLGVRKANRRVGPTSSPGARRSTGRTLSRDLQWTGAGGRDSLLVAPVYFGVQLFGQRTTCETTVETAGRGGRGVGGERRAESLVLVVIGLRQFQVDTVDGHFGVACQSVQRSDVGRFCVQICIRSLDTEGVNGRRNTVERWLGM